jgi:hypothetical protein
LVAGGIGLPATAAGAAARNTTPIINGAALRLLQRSQSLITPPGRQEREA